MIVAIICPAPRGAGCTLIVAHFGGASGCPNATLCCLFQPTKKATPHAHTFQVSLANQGKLFHIFDRFIVLRLLLAAD